MGAKSAYDNAKDGNWGAAAVDAVGAVVDTVAAVVPGVPGGASTAIKAARAADSAQSGSKAARAAKACCFVAGTLVDSEDGLRPIETIEIGNKVWARDEVTGETALKEVTDLIERHERVIWTVTLTGPTGETEAFDTTDDHPWWIAGQGWKRTDELVAGMAVVTKNGRGMVLTSVIETDRIDATFNLTVADFETYFVGKQRVLVHNCDRRSTRETNAQESRDQGVPEREIGPSGKPKRHSTNSPARKRAIDRARSETARGQSPKVHSNPARGKPHAHGTASDGSKKRPHHNYPKR